MSSITVRTAQNVDIEFPIASVGDRILAIIIDGLVLFAWAALWGFILNGLGGFADRNMGDFTLVLFFIVVYIPLLFYFLFMEILMNGQTIGKRQMKIKVVKLDGSRPRFSSYLLRWLFRIVDNAFVGVVGIIAISSSSKGQRVGDMVAGTTVIKLQEVQKIASRDLIAEVKAEQKAETASVVYPEAEKLSAKDVEIMEEALRIFRTSKDSTPLLATDKKVRELLGIDPEANPIDFIKQLIKDYYATKG